MEKSFSNTFSFDTYRKNLYNGSLEIMVPNLPQNFNKFHVVVNITGLNEEEDKMLITTQPLERKEENKKSEPKPKKEAVKEPVKKTTPVVEEPQEPAEHQVHQNRQYRNYVQAVKRARGHR